METEIAAIPFNPLEFQGTQWIYNGNSYREICRNKALIPIVVIVAECFYDNNRGTTLEISLARLEEERDLRKKL